MTEKEINHFRVVIRVEELNGDGSVMEVVSDHVLGDFPDDFDDTSVGQKSDDFYNKVIRDSGGRYNE